MKTSTVCKNGCIIKGRAQKRQPSWRFSEVRLFSRNSSDFEYGTLQIGRLIFIHLQCWEVLPFCRFQRQWCIKILCPKDPDFYTPLALKKAKGQHLPALEVYKNQSPTNLVKSPMFTNTPCKSTCLYNIPSLPVHCFEGFQVFGNHSAVNCGVATMVGDSRPSRG